MTSSVNSSATDNTVTVTWIPPINDFGEPLPIELSHSYPGKEQWELVTVPPGTSSWTIANLPHSTEVNLKIQAISEKEKGPVYSFRQKTDG